MQSRVEGSEPRKDFGETPKSTGETPVPPREKLPLASVERLHRLLGGEARMEEMILRFIAARYGARSLIYLPANVAKEALKRPADFIRAAKQFCEPELNF